MEKCTVRSPEPASPARALDAIVLSEAIRAFIDSGLMDTLEAGPTSAYDLACRSHVSHAALDLFLAALEAGGVVRRSADDPSQWTLVGGRDGWSTLLRGAERLQPFLDTGATSGLAADRGSLGADYRAVADVLGEVSGPTARRWARLLARPDLSVLEIGAGAAPYTRALLDQQQTVRATILDLEPVIEAQQDALLAAYPDAELTFVGGDVFAADLDDTFDLVVISAFCRLFPDDENQALLDRVAGWLRPGGEVLIADVARTGEERDTDSAIYALSLATRSRGRIHRTADFERWLQRAGFGRPSIHLTDHTAMAVLMAQLDVSGDGPD